MRRLTFTYRDGEIELVSSQQVDMTIPAKPPSTTRAAQRPEFWYELRNAREEILYRLDAPDPIPRDIEVFSNDVNRTLERSPNPPKAGIFSVVIPEIEDMKEIILMRAATLKELKPDDDTGVQIGRFQLTKE